MSLKDIMARNERGIMSITDITDELTARFKLISMSYLPLMLAC